MSDASRQQQRQRVHEIASNCVAFRTRILSRVVSAAFDKALFPFGLKISQLNLLVVLAKLGLAGPAELGRVLKMEASTISRNVSRMRSRGWIEDVGDSADGRLRRLRLADSGWELLNQVFPAWQEAQKQVHQLLGAQASQSLLELGEQIRAQVE